MDNVTHALAGLLLADATIAHLERRRGREVSPRVRATAAFLGVFTAEAPDLDLLYSGPALGMGKLGYLLHHRGHTHTIVVAVLMAAVAWGVAVAWLSWRARRASGPGVVDDALPWRHASPHLAVLALLGALSHIALDWTNSYGVHPFWPFDNRWFYGDAVFIVEPWLWIVGIGALLAGHRSRVTRVLLIGAGLAIIGASWALPFVAREVAIVLAVVAVLWWFVARRVPVATRLTLAVCAWLAVDGVGVLASARARAAVRDVLAGPDERLHDVVLTTAPADPRCFDALVVSTDGGDYRVSVATVAPFPGWRDAARCAALDLDAGRRNGSGVLSERMRSLDGDVTRPDGREIVWSREWRAPLAELQSLATTRCDVSAALRFMRVPAWARTDRGDVLFSDLRYGMGEGGFADLVLPAAMEGCDGPVPTWVPPRQALLQAAEEMASAPTVGRPPRSAAR